MQQLLCISHSGQRFSTVTIRHSVQEYSSQIIIRFELKIHYFHVPINEPSAVCYKKGFMDAAIGGIHYTHRRVQAVFHEVCEHLEW